MAIRNILPPGGLVYKQETAVILSDFLRFLGVFVDAILIKNYASPI